MKKTFYIILFFSFFALLPTISHGAITTSSLTHNSAIIKVSDVFANKKITIELYQNKALIDKKTVTANNEGSASVYYPNLKSITKYDMKVETSTGVISTYSFTTTIEVPEVTLTISNITSNSVKVEAKGFKEASGTTRDIEVSNTDDATQHYYKKQENPPESNGILAATFTDLKPNGNYVANAVRRSKTEFEILNSANFTTTSDTSEKKAPEYWSYYANENKDLSNKVFSTQDLCQEASSNRLGADKNVFYEWQNCFLSDSNGTPIIGDAIPVTPKEKNTPSWSEYKLLAPFAGFDKAPENVGDYLNKIFIIGIGLCGALAVLMMILAGIQYMGEESIFEKSKWRERFKSAIFGLLIALSAYALLNTIDPRLLGGEGLSIRAVTAEIDLEVHGDDPHSPVNGKYCNGKYDAKSPWPSDTKERDLVKKAGITINKDNCTEVGQSNCTSLAGLNTSSVINLKKACPNCDIVITGGTECWLHSQKTQHLPGNSIVDLSTTTSLVSYIEKDNTGTKVKNTSFVTFVKNSAKFMREPNNHYHVINW